MLKKNQKAMLANLIGCFVTIMIAVGLIGPIAQEINNVANCQSSNISIGGDVIELGSEQPKGATDSFGGGGSTHFGGYDNKVQHNSFVDTLASTSIVKTNKSILNPDCIALEGTMLFIINNFTMICIIITLMSGFAVWRITYGGLNDVGAM